MHKTPYVETVNFNDITDTTHKKTIVKASCHAQVAAVNTNHVAC